MIAAANALLLRGLITLPSSCIRNDVASINDVRNILSVECYRSIFIVFVSLIVFFFYASCKKIQLVNVLAERSLKQVGTAGEYHINELLSLFPSLQYGMDVNPKFTAGPTGVEFTKNLSVFDLMGVELVHGWQLDKQNVRATSVIQQKTYNELIEIVVKAHDARLKIKDIEDEINEKDKKIEQLEKINEGNDAGEKICCNEELADLVLRKIDQDNETVDVNIMNSSIIEVDSSDSSRKLSNNDNDNEMKLNTSKDLPRLRNVASDVLPCLSNGLDCASTALLTCSDIVNDMMDPDADCVELVTIQSLKADIELRREQLIELLGHANKGSIIDEFLKSTAHQLTYYGILELQNYLSEETLCVFFRNNHFSTLTKHDGILYILITDLGYANISEVMWEKLDNIDGDTKYVDEFFIEVKPRKDMQTALGPLLSPDQLLAQTSRSEADYQLALHISKIGDRETEKRIDEQEGKWIAAATEASLQEWNEKIGEGHVIKGIDGVKVQADDITQNCLNDSSSSQTDVYPQEKRDRVLVSQMKAGFQKERECENLAHQMQERQNFRVTENNGTCEVGVQSNSVYEDCTNDSILSRTDLHDRDRFDRAIALQMQADYQKEQENERLAHQAKEQQRHNTSSNCVVS